MTKQQLPLTIVGINESIYAGFWIRLASLLLDVLIFSPIIFIELFLNRISLNVFFFTFIPVLFLRLFYNIYLVKRYGGTPGKLIVGIRILKTDGSIISWREAILREIIAVIFIVCGVIINIIAHTQANSVYFDTLSPLNKLNYISSFNPKFININYWAFNVWTISELIVLLFNERRRALHDFIAGTVIVKAKYLDRINEKMKPDTIELYESN